MVTWQKVVESVHYAERVFYDCGSTKKEKEKTDREAGELIRKWEEQEGRDFWEEYNALYMP